MSVSTPFEWQQRNRLMEESDRLGRLLSDLRSAATSRHDYEPYDVTDDEAAIQADAVEGRLGGVENALRRLDAGSYGRCSRCEEAIVSERLEALPAATLCRHCAG